MSRTPSRPAWHLAIALLPLACTGSVGSTDPGGPASNPGDPSAVPTDYAVPVGDLRRLTRREYNNTVRDLLGDTTSPGRAFGQDPIGSSGYEAPGTVGSFELDAQIQAAEKVAGNALARLATLMSCTPKTVAEEEPCVVSFIQTFGSRAFRRPIIAAESADLLTLFKTAKQTAMLTFAEAVGTVIQGILESPNFLYHRERGADAPIVNGDAVGLTNYELASRVSYFVAGTTPDAVLLKAAADGKLTDPAELDAQARRLATSQPALAESLTDFVRQWLQVDSDALEKSPSAYPDFVAVKPLMAAEMQRFLGKVVEQGLPPKALFTDQSVFVNNVSAKAYGLPAGSSSNLVEAQAPGSQRAGVFTQLAFLSTHATLSGSHPVKRGVVMMRRVLCGSLPPPPDDVPAEAPPRPNQTTRERFAEHSTNKCASCHKVIDPLGFAFENFDGMGQFRTTEAGKPVDASGSFTLPTGGDLAFRSASELLPQLAASSDARTCLARQLARYGTQISESNEIDVEVAKELLASPASDKKLTELYMAVVKSKAFRFRKLAPGEVL